MNRQGPRLLDAQEVERQLLDLPGWAARDGRLHASYACPDPAGAARLAAEVADEAAVMGHHPGVEVDGLVVALTSTTPGAGGVTQLDVELAHRAREWAEGLGSTPAG